MKLPLLFLIILVSQMLYSQKWEKGYYYDLEGEKHVGKVKLHLNNYPVRLSFKSEELNLNKIGPKNFIAVCTENDSFIVLKNIEIGYYNLNSIEINLFKVFTGYPISGYIMYYLGKKMFYQNKLVYKPSEMSMITAIPFEEKGKYYKQAVFENQSMIFLIRKNHSNLVPVYNEGSMKELFELVKDDESILNYLKNLGHKPSSIKHALEQYNARNPN